MELAPTPPARDGLQPGRFWSLLEMEILQGHTLYRAGRIIASFADITKAKASEIGHEVLLSAETKAEIADVPNSLLTMFKGRLEDGTSFSDILPATEAQMERLAHSLHNENLGEIAFRARALHETFEDELKRHRLLWLSNRYAPYYLALEPFGKEIPERFPAAIDDIEGAAKSLGLEQGTAAVLHLMRVMECGLKALAATPELGIPYAPSWEGYLSQIAKRIGDPHRVKTPDWIKLEPLFRDLSGDLLTVKQAFRNPTMHVVRKYSAEEAEEIFKSVRRFMQRLAEGLPKPSVEVL